MLAVLVLGSEMPSWFSRTICRTLNTDVLLRAGRSNWLLRQPGSERWGFGDYRTRLIRVIVPGGNVACSCWNRAIEPTRRSSSAFEALSTHR